MKKMKEVREKSEKELNTSYLDLSKEIFDLKNEVSLNKKTEKPHLIREKKRERARVLTALREREGI